MIIIMLTRSSADTSLLIAHAGKIRIGDKSYYVSALSLWNSLPMNIREACTLSSFKKVLKSHLYPSYWFWFAVVKFIVLCFPWRFVHVWKGVFAPALTTIFMHSLKLGSLPRDWRCANISPVFKKGDIIFVSAYMKVEPRSLPTKDQSICCKVMEHAIPSNVIRHLDHRDILTDKQHGFHRNLSCESQLIFRIHDFVEILDQKRGQTDVVIMDFSKAFDVVPHNRLMLKLDCYGIRGPTYKWKVSNSKNGGPVH